MQLYLNVTVHDSRADVDLTPALTWTAFCCMPWQSTAAKKTSPTAAKTTTVSSILEGAVTTGKTKKSKKQQQGGDDPLFPEYYCSLCEVEEPCKSSYKGTAGVCRRHVSHIS